MKISGGLSIFPYSPAGVLRATGPDARTFLQGQFTNDLNAIAPGRPVYGLWLDRKGKVIADSTVLQAGREPEFCIASISSPGAVIEQHLGSHLIADDVLLANETGSWHGVTLFGEGSGVWLAAEARAGLVFPGRRSSGESWEWIFPSQAAGSVAAAVVGAPTLAADEVERMRIVSGIPSVPADIGPGDLPNEGGLDQGAISYSKGCYLGQEVMARIKSMGRVRRTLVRVRGSGALPALPAGLWRGERKEGELRSGVRDGSGFAGLALLSLPAAAAGGSLSLALGASPEVDIVRGP